MFLSKLNPFLVSGVVKDHVIEYFLNNIIGNKDKLKVRIFYYLEVLCVTAPRPPEEDR